MTATKLTVGTINDAGCGDFVPVSTIIDGREYGCDVYANGTVEDWQDGNGLLANRIADRSEVFAATQD